MLSYHILISERVVLNEWFWDGDRVSYIDSTTFGQVVYSNDDGSIVFVHHAQCTEKRETISHFKNVLKTTFIFSYKGIYSGSGIQETTFPNTTFSVFKPGTKSLNLIFSSLIV